MIIANEAAYAKLTTFETIDQLNETTRHYRDMIASMNLRKDVTQNLLTLLEYIKRHSCRFFGVSWKGKRKIAAELGMSDKTVTRLCKRLESIGILKQFAMKRASDMNQTSNAIVILPPVTNAPKMEQRSLSNNENDNANCQSVRQEAPKMSDHENNTSLKQIISKDTYTAASSPYVQFKNNVAYFVEDRKLTSKLYGIYLAQTSYIRNCEDPEDLLNAGLQAIKVTFQATKRKRIRNVAGFFHGTLDRMLDRLWQA